MKFKLDSTSSINAAIGFIKGLKKGTVVEIKRADPKRSLSQNAYLYLLFDAYGAATGNSKEISKSVYKWVNKDVYFHKFKVDKEEFLHIRSTSDLKADEMSQTIDKFRDWSAERGFPLPSADDPDHLIALENLAEQNRNYL